MSPLTHTSRPQRDCPVAEHGVDLSEPWSQGSDEVDLMLALLSGLPARDRQAQETLLALARRDEWVAVLLRQRVLDEGGR